MSNPYAPPSRREGDQEDAPGHEPPVVARPPQDEGGPEPEGGWPEEPRPERPQRPAADPEKVRAASRQVLHFAVLMLATLVTSTLPFPWQVAAVAFALTTMVVGVRALVAVWTSGARGTMLAVVIAGLLLASMLATTMTAMVALWPLQMERQQCLDRALTISATQACERDYRDGLDERLNRLGGG
ncbi:hypothetical protein [Cellulomonas bogoriensis]|uniref:Uncharacterized protein n=1 Tax=Cellulomonas bogoriensis 69B4 = DSM 16987 TaxID=1386082 RepID=A0A0A0BMV9_9CELL|nr:hypothetical protein [Cellulomonas bogoriensis]KGM08409.1 hypothetical protein N869_08280 [Cellulomonas bogoriensis 69B4 = DSM 16987]